MSNTTIYPEQKFDVELNLTVELESVGHYGLTQEQLQSMFNEYVASGKMKSIIKECISDSLQNKMFDTIDGLGSNDNFDRVRFEVTTVV